MKILLIEDNQANADIFKTSLGVRLNAEVTHTLTGIDGVQAARDGSNFDVILIDFDLPDLHGTQVGVALYHLMRRGKLRPAPLVALTAQSDNATRDDAEQLGFDAFLSKPVTETDLVNVIGQLRERG
jgi:two-component system, NarL family, sensor histidine kinase BarA